MSEFTRTEPQRVKLPDGLMRAIELVIADEQTDPERAYVAAVLISFGWALYERQAEFDPVTVKIPDTQWRQICKWLTEITRPPQGGAYRHSTDIDRVNYGLSWMNVGPSSYEEEEAPSGG